MNKRNIAIFVLATVAFVGVLLFVPRGSSSGEDILQTPPSRLTAGEQEQWVTAYQKKIRTLGGPAAYRELNLQVASSSDSVQHLSGHLFGRALYKEEGLPGFPTCDGTLNGGCEHEFTSLAIQDNGIGIIPELNQSCVERSGERPAVTCQHGFGHGLLVFFGYDLKGLASALSACDTVSSVSPIRGCYGGAFMEYNLRIMADNKVRPFTPDAPFELCDAVATPYRSACYFWTGQWMLNQLSPTHAQDAPAFAKAGAYCERAPTAADQRSCFWGLGYFADPAAHYEKAGLRALCEAASKDVVHQNECIGYRAVDAGQGAVSGLPGSVVE